MIPTSPTLLRYALKYGWSLFGVTRRAGLPSWRLRFGPGWLLYLDRWCNPESS